VSAPHARSIDLTALSRVLVADPHDDTRSLYCAALQSDGCDVVEASDGRDALAKALSLLPTFIIAELRLPLIDGVALCEILRRDPATRAVPILIVTAETRPTELERVRKAGADTVLVKPMAPDDMIQEIRRMLTPADDGEGTSITTRTNVIAQRESGELLMRAPTQRKILATSHSRFKTTTPPTLAPVLMCPLCDRALIYDHSYIGGVSDRQPEQWDYYVCPASCGTFQYRQRTRKVRRAP
jgi:CheY-like chemotaxis protein